MKSAAPYKITTTAPAGPAAGSALTRRAGPSRHCLNWLGAVWLVLLVTAGAARAGTPPPLAEHQIKALYLFNFIKYVDWPASAFATTNSPYSIGIVEDDDLGNDLCELTKARRINGREIIVKPVRDPETARTCHVLFLSAGEDQRTRKEMLDAVADHAVLTVEDREGPAGGTGVRFLRQDDNLRLEINLTVVQRANLTVSPRLLAVAIVVNDPVLARKN